MNLHDAMAWHASDWTGDFATVSLTFKKKFEEQTPEIKKNTQSIIQQLIQKISEYTEGEWTAEFLQTSLMDWIDTNNLGRGDMLWPLRVALTGREQSPAPFAVASVIGKADVLRRLKLAHDSLAETRYTDPMHKKKKRLIRIIYSALVLAIVAGMVALSFY